MRDLRNVGRSGIARTYAEIIRDRKNCRLRNADCRLGSGGRRGYFFYCVPVCPSVSQCAPVCSKVDFWGAAPKRIEPDNRPRLALRPLRSPRESRRMESRSEIQMSKNDRRGTDLTRGLFLLRGSWLRLFGAANFRAVRGGLWREGRICQFVLNGWRPLLDAFRYGARGAFSFFDGEAKPHLPQHFQCWNPSPSNPG